MACLLVWGWTTFAAIGGFMYGYDIGAISGVQHMTGFRHDLDIPELESNVTAPCTDDVEASVIIGLIVSAFSLGCIFGAPVGGVLAEGLGRKLGIIVGGVLYSIGGAIQAGATHIWVIVLGRVVAGLGKGIIFMVVPVYIAELSPNQKRGRMVSMNFLAMPVGFLAGIGMSAALQNVTGGWRVVLGIMFICGAVLACGMLFLPETPRWLVKKHKVDKATKVLARMHPGEDIDSQVKEIQAALERTQKWAIWDLLRAFFTWTVIERVLIGITLQVLGRLTGITVISYYLVTIICKIGLDGYIGSIVIGCVNIIGCFLITPILADLTGRKTMLLLGTSVQMLAFIISGTLTMELRLQEEKNLAAEYAVVVMICLFYVTFVSMIQPAVGIVDSEMHPLKVRAISVSFTTSSSWMGNLIGTQIAPLLFESRMRLFGTFYLLAGINLLAFLFILLTLPETKGQPLERIGELFQRPWLERTDVLFYLRCGCPWWKLREHLKTKAMEKKGNHTHDNDNGTSTDVTNSTREEFPLLPTGPVPHQKPS